MPLKSPSTDWLPTEGSRTGTAQGHRQGQRAEKEACSDGGFHLLCRLTSVGFSTQCPGCQAPVVSSSWALCGRKAPHYLARARSFASA